MEFDSIDENFVLEVFESAPIGQSDSFFIENFAGSPLLERTLLQIFNPDPSVLVDTDESSYSIRQQTRYPNNQLLDHEMGSNVFSS